MSKKTRTTKRNGKITKITTIIEEELQGAAAPVAQTASPIHQPPAPQLTNEVIFVLDDSGSMDNCYLEAVKQLNASIRNVKEQAAKTGQKTVASIYLFGAHGPREPGSVAHDTVRCRALRQPIEAVSELDNSFGSGGCTPLAAAMVRAIEEGLLAPDSGDTNKSYLLVVVTDGGENASGLLQKQRLPGLVRQVQQTDRWTIACMVPRGDKRHMVNLGIPEGNVTEWDNTVEGTRKVFHSNSVATNVFYGARAAGAKSVRNYFTMDLAKFDPADLAKMTDVSGCFKTWTVDKESEIQAFVEGKGYRFFIGAGYYPLTKKELLRAGRNVLVVRQNSNGPVYGGKQARQILGIPDGEVHVTPGNHAGWDIYFQSTSRNRHLVRGTRLFYDLTKLNHDQETWDSAAAKAAADAKKAAQPTI